MAIIPVDLGTRSYQVQIASFEIVDAAASIAAAVGKTSGVAVLVDGSLVGEASRPTQLLAALRRALPDVLIQMRALPAGEACKTWNELGETCEWLAEQGFDRGAVVLGIGGGATTDHAGFAAATYQRGVRLILCPTTLLAMVDASVGGKTAVDLRAGKNLVGAFHQPSLVLADINFLQTLPPREQAAGMAEIVKAGLIADAELFLRLEREARAIETLPREIVATMIADAVRIKADVVREDERESGRRAILNFGHTVGHAIESESVYALLHGEAVSLGMMVALKLGHLRGITPPELITRTEALLGKLNLPVDVAGRLTASVLNRIAVDKKRQGRDVGFVLVPAVGQAVVERIPLAELRGPNLLGHPSLSPGAS